MAKSDSVSTTKSQRIFLCLIALLMLVGTIGSFALIVLGNDNSQKDQARLTELMAEYQKQSDEYQAKVDKQSSELSSQYYDKLSQHSSRVATFNKGSVEELSFEDLVIGDGEELTKDSSFTAYYIGWNPDGKIFDQSIDGNKLKAPFSVSPGMVITGWTEGAVGMKIGGIREMTIPSDKAYGEMGQGEDIPPNTPLKFIVMVIPTPDSIAQPEPSEELIKLYNRIGR